MKLVIFGLTISSSWGNGHATLWRGLCRALGRRGHRVIFFERDVPYYAINRDLKDPDGVDLRLYPRWEEALPAARREVADADAAMVTSYCPDGVAASELVLGTAGPLPVFYDLDTPITLERLRAGEAVPYLPPGGLGGFDLVLSYTGGPALDELRQRLGARRVAPLYGSVDPELHRPAAPVPSFQGDLSYLGTYAADRQEVLERLFLQPARCLPEKRFVIGGAQYPTDFPWGENVWFVRHLPPADHPAFFASSPLTLNVTRGAMASMGWCPSGRLFEAAACGAAVLSDTWEGLDRFFEPGREILTAESTEEAVAALSLPLAEIRRVARAARERTLAEHTAERRAAELVEILGEQGGSSPHPPSRPAPTRSRDNHQDNKEMQA
ncbi:MAG TPA: glycosyltransferase [Thermoanaerobaculia bacterium]|jgi:spore maturation protein CgeB|nr:glycosyltransferase [Thermoanaerobaculia bacterium]